MTPFWQSVIVSVVTGGSLSAILTTVQFFIKRRDEKKDKKSGVKAELSAHGEQLDRLKKLVSDGNDNQQTTQELVEKQGNAISPLFFTWFRKEL